ncbi:MAG: hypothetical protein CML16_04065 [Pusillimonas sp.]|nr:hypothetical protein [Pusillimonas sp.]MBC41805.1 hypothetical protein [Pusillimonas sp.]HCP76821.1 hypothetical protein [Pusillimonas sp.]
MTSPDTEKIIETIQQMERSRNSIEQKRYEETKRSIDQMKDEIKVLMSGFPDSDPGSHRRYHESVIEWRETRNRLVKEALAHAAKVGGVAAAGWVVYALWIAFKMELHK